MHGIERLLCPANTTEHPAQFHAVGVREGNAHHERRIPVARRHPTEEHFRVVRVAFVVAAPLIAPLTKAIGQPRSKTPTRPSAAALLAVSTTVNPYVAGSIPAVAMVPRIPRISVISSPRSPISF